MEISKLKMFSVACVNAEEFIDIRSYTQKEINITIFVKLLLSTHFFCDFAYSYIANNLDDYDCILSYLSNYYCQHICIADN